MTRKDNKPQPIQRPGQPLQRPPPSPHIEHHIQQLSIESHRGPLPPPAVLQAYEDVVPGSAKQIVDLAVAQTYHRIKDEDTRTHGEFRMGYAGIAAGTIVSLSIIALAGYIVSQGGATVAATLVGMPLAAIVGAFIYGTRSRRKEREAKAELMRDVAEK